MDKKSKTPIEKLMSSLESRRKNLVNKKTKLTEVYDAQVADIDSKVEILDIQINAFKNKK